jgi:hypothetical protein
MFAKISNAAACVTLASALIGCREEHLNSEDAAVTPAPAERHIRTSLPDALNAPEGVRVYLSQVKLVPVASPTDRSEGARYEVVDQSGQRMSVILVAPLDSFLWQLAPVAGGREYSDFGGIVQTNGAQRVLSIFKLAN